jgi:hypothetical protein
MANKQKQRQNKPKQQPKQQPKAVKQQNVAALVKSAVSAALKGAQPAARKDSFLGSLGQFAGNSVSKIFGLGAYKMNSNSLFSNATGTQVPVMHSSNESVVFRHREYIGEVSSSTVFSLTPYAINPGLASSFPYLSTIASCFQEYKFRGLIYEFKSTGATALVSGTNTAMGTVSMVAQYRADAPTPTNKLEMLNEMWAADAKTSDSFILPIECSPKENPMKIQYVRTGSGFTGDIKLYDLAKLSIATVGSQGANVVGELWASYEIELYKPLLSPSGGLLAADHWQRSSTGSASQPFGLIATANVTNQLGTVVTGTTITFPIGLVGYFQVLVYHSGTSAAITYGALTFSSCSALNIFNGTSPTEALAPSYGVSSGLVVMSFYVNIPPSSNVPVVNFAVGTFPTSATIDIIITEVPDNFS